MIARHWQLGTFLLVVIASSLRLWAVDYPPLIDWPNHLARHAIQCGDATYGSQAAYYDFALRIVPNLTADLVYALPFACTDIFTTQKVLIQFALLGLIGSAFLLHAAVWRRASAWPGLVVLIAFNMNLGYGFENYVLAAPLAIGLLALWICLLNSANWLRTVLFIPLGAGLYVCHLYAFAFFGFMLGAIELQRAWDQRGAPLLTRLTRLCSSAAIGLWPAFHFITNQSAGEGLSITATAYGGLISRLTSLLSLVTPQHFFLLERDDRLLALATLFVLGLIPLLLVRFGGRFSFDRRLHWALLACGVLFLAMPAKLATVHFTDIRFPILIVIVVIAATRPNLTRRSQAVFLIVLSFGFLALSEVNNQNWRAHSREVAELLRAADEIEPTDRLFVMRNGVDAGVVRHSHTAAYLAIAEGAFLPTLFNGANPLTPHNDLGGRTATQAFPPDIRELLGDGTNVRPQHAAPLLADWDSYFTHVLVLHAAGAARSDIDGLGRRIQSGTFFDLYELR